MSLTDRRASIWAELFGLLLYFAYLWSLAFICPWIFAFASEYSVPTIISRFDGKGGNILFFTIRVCGFGHYSLEESKYNVGKL